MKQDNTMNFLKRITARGPLAAVWALCLAALVPGCREIDPDSLDLSEQWIRVGVDGTAVKGVPVRVISNTGWEASGYPEWIHLSDESGRGSRDLTVYVDAYNEPVSTGQDRQAVITFRTKGSDPLMETITVNQSKHQAELRVLPVEYFATAPAGRATFTVVSNTTWKVMNGAPWAAISGAAGNDVTGRDDAVVTVEYEEYAELGAPDRVANFAIVSDGPGGQVVEEFVLTQSSLAAPELNLGETRIDFPAIIAAAEASHWVPVITNIDASSLEPVVTAHPVWMTAMVVKNPVSGMWFVKITPTDNTDSASPRSGVVTIMLHNYDAQGHDVSAQITVTQDGAEVPGLEVTSSIINLAAAADGTDNVSADFGYVSGHTPVVISWPEWLAARPEVNAIAGTATGTIAFEATDNPTTLPRQGTITLVVSALGIDIPRSVSIIQAGTERFTVAATPSAVGLPAADDTATGATDELAFEVFLQSPVPGAAITNIMQVDGNWIVPPATGLDNTAAAGAGSAFRLAFAATANPGAASRRGTVEVFLATGNQSFMVPVTVNQAGVGAPAISVMPAFVTVPNEVAAQGTISAGLILMGAGSLAGTPTLDVVPAGWLDAAVSADGRKIELRVRGVNPAVGPREAAVYVVAEQGGVTQMTEVGITQPGTGGALVAVDRLSYEADAPAQTLDIPALAAGGTTYEVLSCTPAAMFDGAPVINSNAGGVQESITVKLKANESVRPLAAGVVLLATNGDDARFYSIAIRQAGVEAPELIPAATEVYTAATATAAPHIFVPLYDWDAQYTFLPLAYDNREMFDLSNTGVVVDAAAGASLQIAVTGNTTLQERRGSIGVAAQRGGKTQVFRIAVVQAAADAPALVFPATVYEYGPEATAAATQVFFENPGGATVALKGTLPAWIGNFAPAAAPDADNVSFTLAANDTSESRSASIVLEAAAGTNRALYAITVVQAGQGPLAATLLTANVSAPWRAGTLDDRIVVLDIPAGTTPADMVSVTSAEWLTASAATVTGAADAAGTARITLAATRDNPLSRDRFATVVVTVKRGNETQHLTVNVVQQGAPVPQIELATHTLTIPAGAPANAGFTVDIFNLGGDAAIDWDVRSSDAAFVTGGITADVLTVTLASGPNATTGPKTATLTVLASANGETATTQLEVTQLGVGEPELVLGANSLVFGATARTGAVLHFANPGGATVTATYPAAPAGWITPAAIDAGTDDGAGSLTFDIMANGTSNEVHGEIVLAVTSGGRTAYYPVGVVQKGLSPLNVDVAPVTLAADAAKGATTTSPKVLADRAAIFGIPAGASAGITSLSEWVIPGRTTIAGDGTAKMLTIGVTENGTGYPRTGTVVIEVARATDAGDVRRFTVSVLQAAEPADPGTGTDTGTGASLADSSIEAQWTAGEVGSRLMLMNLPAGTAVSNIEVVSSASWLALADTDPIVVSGNNATIAFKVAANPNPTSREAAGVITVTSGGELQSIPFTVVQEAASGPQISTAVREVVFGADDVVNATRTATLLNVSGEAGVTYTVQSGDESFVTGTVDAATGVLTVTLQSGPNMGYNTKRTGIKVISSAGGITSELTVDAVQLAQGSPELVVGASSMTFGASGSASATLYFANPNKVPDVVVMNTPAWITAGTLVAGDTDGAGSLQFAVAPNTSPEELEGEIVLKASSGGRFAYYRIGVVQRGVTPMNVGVAPLNKLATHEAALLDGDVHISGIPAGATVTVLSLNSSWLTAGTVSGAGTFSVSVLENTTGADRAGTILVEVTRGAEVQRFTVSVLQAAKPATDPGPGASLAASSIAAQWTAGEVDSRLMLMNLPAGITVGNIAVVSSASWLTLADTAPIVITGNNATIALKVAANPRTTPREAAGVITVTAGGEVQNIPFTLVQEAASGPQIGLATGRLTIPAGAAAGTAFTVDIFNTGGAALDYSAPGTRSSDNTFVAGSSAADVLTVRLISGPNTTTQPRNATITVMASANGETASAQLEVVQLGLGDPELVVGAGSMTFGPAAQTGQVLYFSNLNGAVVNYVSGPAWVSQPAASTLVQGVGDGAGSLTFAVAGNDSAAERNGRMVLSATLAGKTAYYEVGVVQKGLSPLNVGVSPLNVLAGPEAQTALGQSITISGMPAGATASVTSLNAGMVSVPAASIPGDGSTKSFQAGVTQNNSGRPRLGTVLVEVTRGAEVQRFTVSVLQAPEQAVIPAMPAVIANPNSLTFPATVPAAATTVTLGNTAAAYTYMVSAPDWLTVTQPAGNPVAFTVTAASENGDGAARTGNVVLSVVNGDKVQTISIAVTQQAAAAPVAVYPLVSSATFPAEAGGAGAAQLIEIAGFDSALHDFAVTSAGWLTVVPPASAMKVYPNGVWAGPAARRATLYVTITDKSDGRTVSQFPITVTQQAPDALNIGYAPKTHALPIEGGPVNTLFTNPDGLALQVVSPSGNGFVQSATFSASGQLDIIVAPNAGPSRSTIVNVVSRNAGGTVIGEYPVTIYQEGTGGNTPAPVIPADITTPPATYDAPAAGVPIDVTFISSSARITSAVVAIPGDVPAWLRNLDVASPGPGTTGRITYDIDPTAGGWPTVGSSTAVVQVTVEDGGSTFHMYYTITAMAFPPVAASLVSYAGNIAASATTASIPFADDGGTATPVPATVDSAVAFEYVGSESGWLSSAVFAVAGTSPTKRIDITGIAPNTSTTDRSAIVKIKVTQPLHQEQNIHYVLTQKGIPTIDAVYDASYMAVHSSTSLTIEPTDHGAAGAIVTPINPLDFPGWVDSHSVNGDRLTINFTANPGATPRTGDISFTLRKAGYADQEVSVAVIQMPPTPNMLLSNVSATAMAWTQGSEGTISYTNNVAGTRVTVFEYDHVIDTATDPDPSGTTPAGATNTTGKVTAMYRNAMGVDLTGHVLLKAENGTTVEYYDVMVSHLSLTPAELRGMFSFTTGKVRSSDQNYLGDSNFGGSFSWTSPSDQIAVVVGTNASLADQNYIGVNHSPLIADYTGALDETGAGDSGPDFFNSVGWDATEGRMLFEVRANGSRHGWSYYAFTVEVDLVTAVFNITFTR